MRGRLDKDALRLYDELRHLVDDDTLLTRTHVRVTFASAKRRKDWLRQLSGDDDLFLRLQRWDYRSDAVHGEQDGLRVAFPDGDLDFDYPAVFPREDLPAVVSCLRRLRQGLRPAATAADQGPAVGRSDQGT